MLSEGTNRLYRVREQLTEYGEEEGYVCGICGSLEDLTVDHDHRCHPGSTPCLECVRGFLCRTCNIAEGKLDSGVTDGPYIEWRLRPPFQLWRARIIEGTTYE